MRSLAEVALLALALGGCRDVRESLPYYQDAALTPVWLTAAESAGAHRVGAFELTDQAGAPFAADSLAGRVYVASFFFATCRDICPTTVRRLQVVADSFAAEDRFMLVSFSVTPQLDSVPALAMYAEMHGIPHRRWRLLTGPRDAIERVAKAHLVGLGRGQDYGVDAVAHTEMVGLVDGAGHLRGVYNGTLALDMAQLVRDARTLLARSGEGRPAD
jgi:protein SCO1/2